MLFDGALGFDLTAKATAALQGDNTAHADSATPATPEAQRTDAPQSTSTQNTAAKPAEQAVPTGESAPGDHIVGSEARTAAEKDPATGRTVTVDKASGDRVLERLVEPSGPNARNEIVFVDTSVAGYETLLTGVKPEARIVLLDSTRDGIQQMADFLS